MPDARYIIARLITRDSHDANDILAALAADGWRVVKLRPTDNCPLPDHVQVTEEAT